MESDDLLYSRNARLKKALARATGTPQRASGWAGVKVAGSGNELSCPVQCMSTPYARLLTI